MTVEARKLVFLSHPVMDYVSSTGPFRSDKRLLLERVVRAIESTGNYHVECAGLNERYGERRLTPEQFTQYDIDALQRCEEFIMVSTLPPTPDMCLELGVALGRRVPCSIFLPSGTRVTSMVRGLASLERLALVKFDEDAALPASIERHLGRLRAGACLSGKGLP